MNQFVHSADAAVPEPGPDSAGGRPRRKPGRPRKQSAGEGAGGEAAQSAAEAAGGARGPEAPAPVPADDPQLRGHDPDRTMADILAVATREFSEKGLAGARIDEIAAATRTSKRMIYYYYGSKEELYVAVLENAYRQMRAIESELHLDDLPPEDALRRLVGHTVDYQLAHPEFLRLVATENIHRGQYLARSKTIRELNVPAIEGLRRVYERGVAAGVFRAGLDPVDLHMSISALSVFNVANRHTFSLIFQREMDSPRAVGARRDSIVDMVVRHVRK